MENLDSLAKRLAYARKKRGFTQDELAELSSVKQSDISKIERSKSFKSTNLVGLATALNCSPGWLDTGAGDWQDTGPVQSPESPNLEALLKGVGQYLEKVDGKGRGYVKDALARLVDDPASYPQAAAAILIQIDVANAKVA